MKVIVHSGFQEIDNIHEAFVYCHKKEGVASYGWCSVLAEQVVPSRH
jgi:hypothetical protein